MFMHDYQFVLSFVSTSAVMSLLACKAQRAGNLFGVLFPEQGDKAYGLTTLVLLTMLLFDHAAE